MKLRNISYFLILVYILTAGPATELRAQFDSDYHVGNQLFQQQKYEEAYRVFKKLHDDNPETFLFLEKATECLINLKRYEEAIEITEKAIRGSSFPGLASNRLGKIYHIKGDTARAFSIWDQTIEKYDNNFQIYLSVARTMSDRRAFQQAVDVYETARQQFSNSTLLATELANTYMQAGLYEKAINEYLRLVKQDPERIDYVQRSLLRYGDEYLHDTAILEIEEFIDDLSLGHPSHRSLHQLQLWLLLERNLYRRALASAKNYEKKTSQATFTLFGLGSKLLSEREYELAEEAYQYYIDQNIIAAKYQSMEKLSEVYTEWADYLSDYNLAHAERRKSLYQKAFDVLKKLQTEAPFYDHMGQVLIRQAELAIDYLDNVDLAKNYLEALRSRNKESAVAQQYYVEGRIKLYEGEYARARIAFTKSNKQERIGDLAEKTRYYLALTDFYAGDYEFAKIQLNALERQNTSYFANDAVQLRIWIQKGLNADSTGSLLEPFAESVELFNRGKDGEAVKTIAPVVSGKAYHPMMDEALLVLSKNITPDLTYFTYAAISNYLDRWGQVSALRERLMWEKARIADQVVTENIQIQYSGNRVESDEEPYLSGSERANEIKLPASHSEVVSLYENILLEYPDGFYASFARDRIQDLRKPQT